MDGYIGEIRAFPYFRGTPEGWLPCNGTVILIGKYTALYAIINGLYGPSTSTTFTLPNIRGEGLVGAGTGPGLSPRAVGQAFGTETDVLTFLQVPNHTHQMNGTWLNSGAAAATPGPQAGSWFTYPGYATSSGDNWGSNNYDTGPATVTMAAGALSVIGGSAGHENRQPFLNVNWCICYDGVFPTQE